ncbi:MAG: hypothetical protein H0T89_36710 [Deltaproteobacteria bacterium]|nr:hypothetical protein [Deltaproteobacteria bacterium]MBA3819105.1 hypothetical protein [Deltaproteobacteria bacterium]
MRHLGLLIALAGCNDPGRPTEIHELGTLEYELPAGWQAQEQVSHGRRIVVWSPTHNPRKETITLVRSEPLPALTKAGAAAVSQHLAAAQLALRGRFMPATTFKTSHGLAGARMEGSFTPAGVTQPYGRVHAVVVDGDSLVHVLYTAQQPDASLETFDGVLDTLQRKGA